MVFWQFQQVRLGEQFGKTIYGYTVRETVQPMHNWNTGLIIQQTGRQIFQPICSSKLEINNKKRPIKYYKTIQTHDSRP